MTDSHAPLFLCVGDIDVDLLIAVEQLPTRDGKVNGEVLQRVPGGMAANVSVALARLGAPVRILGRVGDDEEADLALDGLARSGIDVRHVARLAGTRTFSCIGLVTPDGERSLIKLMTEAYRPAATDLTPEACDGVGHVHLTSVGDPELCRRVVAAARAGGASASLDVETADCPADADALLAALAGFDLLFCNRASRSLIGDRLGRARRGRSPTIVTTLGDAGARVEAADGTLEAPGRSAAVRDTTGAGDCFAAACLHARLAQSLRWPEALAFANQAAALSTQGLGAQSALPTLAEVRQAQRP